VVGPTVVFEDLVAGTVLLGGGHDHGVRGRVVSGVARGLRRQVLAVGHVDKGHPRPVRRGRLSSTITVVG